MSMDAWRPIETAPKDGTQILVWWPVMKLDEENNLTAQQAGGARLITWWQGNAWIEADSMEAMGAFFGDDCEYGYEPTLWAELPPEPVN